MDNETEIIKKYIRNLSQEMRDYLAKDEWKQKLSYIAQANGMTEEQSSDLAMEVILILVGIENFSDLRINIQKNIAGIGSGNTENIANAIEKDIFSGIKPLLIGMEKINNEADGTSGQKGEENLSKDSVLNEIENPAPTKPIISNPAGKNPILDAQHNLPEMEKKVLISSAAVPSRGPILSNFKTSFVAAPTIPATPTPTPTTPPIAQPTPATPIVPTAPQQVQPPKTPQTPTPPAPTKYTIDPYREPLE